MKTVHDGQMSEKEAKAEADSINREIAESKGLDPETGKPKEATPEATVDDVDPSHKEGDEEERETTENPEKKTDEDETSEDDDQDKPDEEEGEDPTTRQRGIPPRKYQELKHTLKEVTAAKDAEIAKLKADLESSKTSKESNTLIKDFAEKHGSSEEMTADLINLVKAVMPKPDPASQEAIKKAEIFAKKQEAQEAFQSEFADLVKDVPDAADHLDKIQKEAYKDGNLNRSLFEIFHRFVKPNLSQPRRTGESSRGPSGVRTSKSFNIEAIAAKVKSGSTGAFEGLSGEQVDQVFEYMEKTGSRFNG